MLSIRSRTLTALTLGYLALPVALFLSCWLKPWFGIPSTGLLLAALWWHLRREDDAEVVDLGHWAGMLGLLAALALWVFLSGLGGYYYQSNDHHWRNAIFHDLIDFAWPVRYGQTGSALVYYMAYWLPAALVGKAFGWAAANAALYLWSLLGVALCALLLWRELKARTFAQRALIVAVLGLFSGMDVLGQLLRLYYTGKASWLHLEWWSGYYQYSSNTTQLFWVYNQTIAPWLATVLLLRQRRAGGIALLCGLTLPFAPMPLVGMLPLALAQVLRALRDGNRKTVGAWFRGLLHVETAAALALGLVFALYFSSNASAGGGRSLWFLANQDPLWPAVDMYCVFLLLEVAVPLLALLGDNRREPLYWAVLATLLLCPLIAVGKASDFCMRASIPALMALMVLCLRLLLQPAAGRPRRGIRPAVAALAVFLVLGAATPLTEVRRGLLYVHRAGRLNLTADSIRTLRDKGADYSNFLTFHPEEQPFYRFLGR